MDRNTFNVIRQSARIVRTMTTNKERARAIVTFQGHTIERDAEMIYRQAPRSARRTINATLLGANDRIANKTPNYVAECAAYRYYH